jgi:hypothetical protein
MYALEMASCGMISFPVFMKIATGVQTIFIFCLRNLNGYNVDITDGRDLFYITPLRWTPLTRYTYKGS